MDKLVLKYSWCIPHEASGEENIPFEYESKEQAWWDFVALWEKSEYEFDFLGKRFTKPDTEHAQIFTLDEWFEKNKLQKKLGEA